MMSDPIAVTRKTSSAPATTPARASYYPADLVKHPLYRRIVRMLLDAPRPQDEQKDAA